MKFGIKKFIFLLNDLTSILLSKERDHSEERIKRLKTALLIVTALLLASIIFNVYLSA